MTATGDILLFVHGVCHGGWCWEKYFVPYFSQRGYRCRALDLPGHSPPGSQKKINHFSLADYVRCLEDAVQALDQVPILVGHSMGGMVVQKYLERAPGKKAIFLAPVPPSGAWRASLRFLRKYPRVAPHFFTRDLYAVFHGHARAALFRPDLPEHLLEEFKQNMCAESFKAYLQLLFPRVTVRHQVEIPVLVLGAGDDLFFSPREMRRMADRYRADLQMIPGVAHNMMLDTRHRAVAEAMLAWLARG